MEARSLRDDAENHEELKEDDISLKASRKEEEFTALTAKPGFNVTHSKRSGFLNCRDCLTVITISCFMALVIALLFLRKEKLHQVDHPLPPQYSCPVIVKDSDQNPHLEDHTADDYEIISNLTEFVESFRIQPFDRWAFSYQDFKAGVYQWKSTRFAPYLENGSTIYESASGIGLNLLMTLEIMHQVKGLENLIVYGNEYIPESVSIGLELLTNRGLLRPMNGHVGQFCRGDSIDLKSFVPANAFDLVFTGYLTPLYDPLQLNLSDWELDAYYAELCLMKPSDNNSTASVSSESTDTGSNDESIDQKHHDLFLLQRRQEDWFGVWVAEMIRIAKPGAPIIVEQISRPTCEAPDDWGGVSPDFWNKAVKRYGWNVDPESIACEDDVLTQGQRYHVFMTKNKNGFNH